jgi:translocator protein
MHISTTVSHLFALCNVTPVMFFRAFWEYCCMGFLATLATNGFSCSLTLSHFMLSLLNQPNTTSLILNILVALVAVSAMNRLIFGLGWNNSIEPIAKSLFAPPTYLIGIVWTILFVLMATARWQLNFDEIDASARTWVTVLIISCLVYPLYTLAFDNAISGLLGNLETIALAAFVIFRVWSISKFAALLIVPIIPWVLYASSIIIRRILVSRTTHSQELSDS